MRQRSMLITGIAVLGLAGAAHGAAYRVRATRHDDGRQKLEFDPAQDFSGSLKNQDLALSYLQHNAERYGIKDVASELKLASTQKSLLGTHYHYQQIANGAPVENGEIIVSVTSEGDHIFKVYNSLFPSDGQGQDQAGKAALTQDQAYDVAWKRIGVSGDLNYRPQISLVSFPYKGGLRLAYRVYLQVSEPLGAWEVHVDAKSGEVLSYVDKALPRAPMKRPSPVHGSGQLTDRRAAFNRFAAKEARKARFEDVTAEVAQGKGLVFDPDPRTTLMDNDLQNDSPASAFENAYFQRDLKDISKVGDKYTLKGPWVNIIDFESPSTPPSTTTDGVWTAKRGNNAFNDSMTYFHLDQNQRYMQSLGFKDDRGIQFRSIEVDTDGVNGDDNSHFIPGSNRLAFGHGCVPDNEDADVILHEYGHAINYSINRNFNGGDSGAMGEGFGDYWAGSYSVSTPNGMNFHKEFVFTWDGHGNGDKCWPGRILNAIALKYDPSRTYGAHMGIGGGRASDELWSTPLFQTLITAMGQGIARADIDRVILEAQFGLGSGLKMRDMANAIIRTSERLLPAATPIFVEKFTAQNIIDVPHAQLGFAAPVIQSPRRDARIFPGDSIALKVPLTNSGTAEAKAVSLKASTTTADVEVSPAAVPYGDIAIGQTVTPQDAVTVTVGKDVTCGAVIKLNLDVNYNGNQSTSAPLELQTGVAQGANVADNASVAIPDNQATGVSRTLTVSGTNAKVSDKLAVSLKVTHSYRGDLKVVLTSPRGTKVTLHDRSGGSAANLEGVYPTTLSPAQSLSALVGEDLDGTWTLTVSDNAGGDTGSLVSWGLSDVSGYICQ